MKASDINDQDVLAVVDHVFAEKTTIYETPAPANVGDLTAHFEEFPEKVVIAKLRQLIKRKLLTGCTCGCRGEFEVTQKGYEMLSPGAYDSLEAA